MAIFEAPKCHLKKCFWGLKIGLDYKPITKARLPPSREKHPKMWRKLPDFRVEKMRQKKCHVSGCHGFFRSRFQDLHHNALLQKYARSLAWKSCIHHLYSIICSFHLSRSVGVRVVGTLPLFLRSSRPSTEPKTPNPAPPDPPKVEKEKSRKSQEQVWKSAFVCDTLVA